MILSFNSSWHSNVNSNILFLVFLDNLTTSQEPALIPNYIQKILEASLLAKCILITEEPSYFETHRFKHLPNLAIFSNNTLHSFYEKDNFLESSKPIKNFRKLPFVIRTEIYEYFGENCTWEDCQYVREFVKVYNASIHFVSQPFLNVTLELDNYILDNPNFTYSKYFEYVSTNLVVPMKSYPNKYFYYLLPFSGTIWILHFLTILSIAALASVFGRMKSKSGDVSLRFLNAWQISILQSFRRKGNYQNQFLNWIYALATFYGMIVGGLYCSYLGSIFTTNADVSKYPILCESELLAELKYNFPKVLQNFKFFEVPQTLYWEIMYKLDTNYGFCMENIDWRRLDAFQKTFKSKIFRKMYPDSPGHTPQADFVRKGSIFAKSLAEFKTWEMVYGFEKKWSNDFGRHMFYNNVLKLVDYSHRFTAITLDDLKLTLFIIFGGSAISTLIFLAELFLKR